MAPKILVSDALAPEGIKILSQGFQVDQKTNLKEDELCKIIGEYDALVIRSGTTVTKKIIEQAKNLKVIARAGVGVDNVDLEAATKKGIVVVNSPEGNTTAAAEHTIALLFALARSVPQATESMHQKKWDRKSFTGVEVYNKTLGVVGLGKIGRRVAKYAQGLDMKVIGYDPFLPAEIAAQQDIKLLPLDQVIAQADFLTLHIPKTEETHNLLNMAKLKTMKKTARIINCARGGLINETDLAEALKQKIIGGAALDVFEQEPPDFNHALFQAPNLIYTPHLGAATEEAQVNVAIDVAEQVVEVLSGGQARAAVNIPFMKADQLNAVKPYIESAEKVGSFVAQLTLGEKLESIEIEFLGEVANLDTSPLKLIIMKTILEKIYSDERISFVNAQLLANERGLKVTEVRNTKTENYAHLIRVTAKTSKSQKQAASANFEKLGVRIVSINGFKVNIATEGQLILAPNYDRPGVIARVSKILGDSQVNIASMIVARESVGGDAIMLISVDNPIDQATLDKISKAEGIRAEAKTVKF